MDRTGKFGIGFQEQFGAGAASFPGTTLGEWSFKYGINDALTAQLLLGTNVTTKGGVKCYEFGGRVLYNLVKNENSAFYTGLGIAYEYIKGNPDPLRFNLPLGFEFSFAGLPEVGISAEVGLIVDYVKNSAPAKNQMSLYTVGGGTGGNLGLGIHYYF
jgi:hypothetical protein